MSATTILTAYAARAVHEPRLANSLWPDRWWIIRRPILRLA
jgi:hypothetical protein